MPFSYLLVTAGNPWGPWLVDASFRSLPPSLHGVLSVCLCSDLPLIRKPVIAEYNLILIWLHLQGSCIQIRSTHDSTLKKLKQDGGRVNAGVRELVILCRGSRKTHFWGVIWTENRGEWRRETGRHLWGELCRQRAAPCSSEAGVCLPLSRKEPRGGQSGWRKEVEHEIREVAGAHIM